MKLLIVSSVTVSGVTEHFALPTFAFSEILIMLSFHGFTKSCESFLTKYY